MNSCPLEETLPLPCIVLDVMIIGPETWKMNGSFPERGAWERCFKIGSMGFLFIYLFTVSRASSRCSSLLCLRG